MRYMIVALWALLLTASVGLAQSNYRVQPGDVLAIEVLEDSELNRTALVLPDGSFNFPFSGTIRAGGRTVSQIQAAITSSIASNFASRPTVFVSVRTLRREEAPRPPAAPATINVYFLGEIGNPGQRQVLPGTTFLQAISQAGQLTRFAATKRIQLRRTSPTTGAQSVTVINYKALSRGASLSRSIPLQDGDVILIPERRLFE